jgi:hypothetical protein
MCGFYIYECTKLWNLMGICLIRSGPLKQIQSTDVLLLLVV